MLIIQDDKIFNTEKFGAIVLRGEDIIFYSPGTGDSEEGRIPLPREGNALVFNRRDNAKKAFDTIINALCEGRCSAVTFIESYNNPCPDMTRMPLLCECRHYRETGKTK